MARGPKEASQALVALDGGSFLMGARFTRHAEDGETPVREVSVAPFGISATTVTNAQFARFVDVTGYASTAEQLGNSFVFAAFLPASSDEKTRALANAPWWREVEGACWRFPEGPGTGIEHRLDHPIMHVSWHDTQTY